MKHVRFSKEVSVYPCLSKEDYSRFDEDNNPVEASAEYLMEKRVEELEKVSIEIEKQENALGFSVVGIGIGAEIGLEKISIFVRNVSNSKLRIEKFDQVLEVRTHVVSRKNTTHCRLMIQV